jgi:hypothetical protein
VILLDTPTKAGARLAIPSLAAPIGSLISGVVMSRWGRLAYLVRAGCLLMCIGNLLVMSIQFHDAEWKYLTYVIPASLGQGIVYPGILFTFLAAFDHTGKLGHHHVGRSGLITPIRSRCVCIHCLPGSVSRDCLGRCHYLSHYSEYNTLRPFEGLEWNTRQMESNIPQMEHHCDMKDG